MNSGDLIFAGGRQKGANLELEIVKEVSQSYLTQLWNNSALKKDKVESETKLAANFSKYFTYITLIISFGTGVYWYFNDATLVWPALTAVLMVACPCALTLSMPFTMTAVMNIFGKNGFYVKNSEVIQRMAEINEMFFDKTGTLTQNNKAKIQFKGQVLPEKVLVVLKSATTLSMHPISKLITEHFAEIEILKPDYFFEHKGAGIEAIIDGDFIKLGNAEFLEIPEALVDEQASVYLKINEELKGYFYIEPVYRTGLGLLFGELTQSYPTHLLSGDTPKERLYMERYFGAANLHFELKPQAKLDFITLRQKEAKNVMMLGDGLNDAGAIGQSNVGIAVSENTQAFTPASDGILEAKQFSKLPKFMSFSKRAINIVKISFLLSLVYNFICISWAVTGQLSPVLAAIFMPISSISVVLFSILLTHLAARRLKLT